jgi:acid stress-induced BolA-like protein IbaG/YrbA
LLNQHFPDATFEFEKAGTRRVGGLLIWQGFSGWQQIERQRQVWQVLRANLPADEQLQVASILTLTPDEMAAARGD